MLLESVLTIWSCSACIGRILVTLLFSLWCIAIKQTSFLPGFLVVGWSPGDVQDMFGVNSYWLPPILNVLLLFYMPGPILWWDSLNELQERWGFFWFKGVLQFSPLPLPSLLCSNIDPYILNGYTLFLQINSSVLDALGH